MKKLNNNGQVLVCFVLLIPIIIIIFALVINLGLLSIEKRKITNTVKDTITYGLKHIDDNNLEGSLRELIKQNIGEISNDNITIDIDNSYIKIKVIKSYQGILKSFVSEIVISYSGNISTQGITLKKEE